VGTFSRSQSHHVSPSLMLLASWLCRGHPFCLSFSVGLVTLSVVSTSCLSPGLTSVTSQSDSTCAPWLDLGLCYAGALSIGIRDLELHVARAARLLSLPRGLMTHLWQDLHENKAMEQYLGGKDRSYPWPRTGRNLEE
jgi:hypothetical protein